MKDYTQKTAELLRANKEGLGLSLSKLAEMSGIPKYRISQMESGGNPPDLNEFMALDRVFDGDLYWGLAE